MLRTIPVTIVLFLSTVAAAQSNILFYGSGGMTYTAAAGRAVLPDHLRSEGGSRFLLSPHAGIRLITAIGSGFVFEAGSHAAIQRFNITDYFTYYENGTSRYEVLFLNRYRFTYIAIPVMLGYTLFHNTQHRVRAGGGIQYAFLIAANRDVYSWQRYRDLEPDIYEWKKVALHKGIVQTSNTFNGTFNMLQTSLNFQLAWQYKRLQLSLFHEQGLYSLYLKDPSGKSPVRIRNTGLSLGYLLPVKK